MAELYYPKQCIFNFVTMKLFKLTEMKAGVNVTVKKPKQV